MKKYFVVTNSFAAPFMSDTEERFYKGNTPQEAIKKAIRYYNHPAGLYSAALWKNTNDYHKGKKPLVRAQCNREVFIQQKTKGLGGYMISSRSIDEVSINDKSFKIDDPRKMVIID